MTKHGKNKILLLEDNLTVLMSLSNIISAGGYLVHPFDNCVNALAEFHEIQPDVVVADVNMPGMSGMEFLEQIRTVDKETPVILMTGHEEPGMARDAIHLNVLEFLLKPFEPICIIEAVANGIKTKRELQFQKENRDALEQAVVSRTFELEKASRIQKNMIREIIERLTTAAEYRDEETGMHISRIGLYANRLAKSLGLPEDFIENITVAAAMHDIGKIGIPDAILFKPSALTTQEFQIITSHTIIGERILGGIITKGDGQTCPEHFDPAVLQAFKETAPLCAEIFDCMQDNAGHKPSNFSEIWQTSDCDGNLSAKNIDRQNPDKRFGYSVGSV